MQSLMEDNFPLRIWPVSNEHFELKPMSHKIGILLLDFDQSCGLNLLHNISTGNGQSYFTTNQFWLLVSTNSNAFLNLKDGDIFFPPDSEIRILIDNESSATDHAYTLLDIYKISATKNFQIQTISENFHQICEMLTDLIRFSSAISYRENLENVTFQTGQAVPFPDQFTQMEDLNMRHVNTITKAHYRVLQNLKEQLNIRL